MRRTRLSVLVCVTLLITGFAGELVREDIVYRRVSRNLQGAHENITPGMSKEQVRKIAGEPDIATANSEEVWHWEAWRYQGRLWTLLGMAPIKGHYTLSIIFDSRQKVSEVWGGIN